MPVKPNTRPRQVFPSCDRLLPINTCRTTTLRLILNAFFVTAGGSGALVLAMALIVNPGDGMLMTDPGYPCNRHFVRSFNGEAQLIPVSAADNFQLSDELVRNNWQDNTRSVLLASPANPTGSVLAQGELSAIAAEVRNRKWFSAG